MIRVDSVGNEGFSSRWEEGKLKFRWKFVINLTRTQRQEIDFIKNCYGFLYC